MKKTIIQILIIALISLNINNTFANYKTNIKDTVRIYKLEQKIHNILEKKKNPEILKNKILKKIEKLLNKNKSEIKKNKTFLNLKEYWLTKIYLDLFYENIFYREYNVLENNYIKIITTDTGFTLNNEKLSWTRKDWVIFNYIEFFKLKSEEKTKEYLKNNFLNKEGKDKCELIEYKNNFNKWKSYYFWLQKKYQSKEIHPWSTICPIEFTKWYSNNWISFFQRISPNTLMYINAGQDYVWIDFSSMEVK